MNGNVELLNYIYQNSQMGTVTIEQLVANVKDDIFKKQLESQLNEYKTIHQAAKLLLNEHGYDEKGIGAFEKLRTYLSVNMQTMSDHTPSHISEMVLLGSTMGVIDAIKNIKKYQNADTEILALMDKLLKFEENNIQTLKSFL